MKISSSSPSVAAPLPSASSRAGAPLSKPTGGGEASRVDISPLSARLQEVEAGAAPVDAQRVAEIKQAIAEGRFKINPDRIADGLLVSVGELLGRSPAPSLRS